jgi:predicted heme/steroid binding protein
MAPGLFTERTARGSTNRYKDGDKVRFVDGLPQTIGGWLTNSLTGATIRGKVRRIHEWQSLDREKWIALGTNSKLYLINQGVVYDITPLRTNAVLTNPFTTTSGLTTVSVAHVAHGAEAGDFVRFSGATAVGGITIDGEYQVTTVTGPDAYVITHSSPASGSATGGGTVTAEYDVAAGGEDTGFWYGYGVCGYGDSTYGTPRGVCSTMARALRIWSLDNWGEDLMASPSEGPVYWWDRTLGPASRAALVATAPSTNQRILVSPDSRQLICLGAHDGSDPDPKNVRVSNNEDFTDFVVPIGDAANDSNVYQKRIDAGSLIISGLRTRNGTLISTDLAIHLMQADADQIYTIRQIGEGNGFIGPNAAVDVDGTVYYMSPSRFMMYDGVLNEIPCEVLSKVFGDQSGEGINLTQGYKVYCQHNDVFNEVWWYYPSAGATENDRYVMYNYMEKHWSFGAIARTAAAPTGATFGKGIPYAFGTTGIMYKHESGNADGAPGTPIPAFLETYDITIQNDQPMHVSHAIPDDRYRTGDIRITLKTKKQPNSTSYTTKGPYVLTTATAIKGVRARGRQMAIRYESGYAAVDSAWRIGAYTFLVQPDGGER